MKYIRTEYGKIYCIEKLFETEYAFMDKNNSNICIGKNGNYKQADTIEELCDEFVVIDKTWEEPLHIVLDTKDDMKSYLPSQIYGAIWTDKGLIYVAKMKGVLPNGEIDWELL